MPAHPLGCPSQDMKKGAAKLGLTLFPNALAIPNRPYNGRPACIYCRGCGNGCVVGDKGSVDVVMVEPAETTGKLVVKSGARVLYLKVNKEGRVDSVVWKGKKDIEKAYGKSFVVSCGAIETPRLLLNSKSSLFPRGLANTNGFVGSYLMTHLAVVLVVFFDRHMKSYQGLPIDSRIWNFSAPKEMKEQGGGTARMGTSSKNSVVDSFGRSHDVKNLFIADASVFVTESCGDSPSLTVIALALRIAEHIASEMKKGNV